MSTKELSKERADFLFDYDEFTGVLTWKNKPSPRANRVILGSVAGNLFCDDRYLQTSVDQKKYMVHRIIWLISYGCFPAEQIDHIDGNGLNNRLSNLREVSDAENKKNLPMRSDNKSGVTGVSWHRKANKWISQIQVKGENNYLGIFTNLEDALKARSEAEIKLDFHRNHGR